MAASSLGLGGRAERLSRRHRSRTSWTARTCLHGPRSPRWRPYHGHVQVQPSAVERTRYSTPPAPATHAASPARPRSRSERLPARRAGARRGGVAGGAPCARDRTAARAGRSRHRRGRSRRSPTGRAPPERAETSPRVRPVVAASASTPEPRLPAERTADRGDARSRRGVRQAMQRPALAGEAAPDLGAEDERQASARHVELPAGAAVAGRGEDPERRRVAGDALEQAEAGKAGQADGALTRVVVEQSAGRDRSARARPAASTGTSGSSGRTPASRRRRARLPGQLGLDRLDLEEPAQPARRQRDPSLDGRRRRPPRPRRRTHRPPGPSGSGPARRPARIGSRPEVDVGRPAPDDLAVVCLGQQVDPAVDAAAGRERLEPQAVVGARRHGIGELEDPREHRRRHVEPRPGDVTERQQQVGGDDRQEQRAPEELRVRRRPTRCREPEPPSHRRRRRAPTGTGSDRSARGSEPREPWWSSAG